MKIKLLEVLRGPNPATVIFAAEFGQARATWRGDDPVAGQTYWVEMDVDDRLHWGLEIKTSSSRAYYIGHEAGAVKITGLLEGLDGQGLADIRLGRGLITVLTAGAGPETQEYVDMFVDNLALFPYEM